MDKQETRVGQTISIFRETRGLTQKELAEKCDVSNVYISNIERGLKSPSRKLKSKIADALSVSDLEFDATMIVFNGLPIDAKKFNPNQIEFLSTLQKLVRDRFKDYQSEEISN